MGKGGKRKSAVTSKQLHPNSRKLQQLKKQLIHRGRQERCQTVRGLSDNVLLGKLKWFQTHLERGKEFYQVSELEELVEKYLCRFEEVSTAERRHSYKSSCKKDGVKMEVERERQLFESAGVEVPDLRCKRVVAFLREWDGDLKWVQHRILMTPVCRTLL